MHLTYSKISFMQNTVHQKFQIVIFGEMTLSSLKKNVRFFLDCHGSSVILLIFTYINLMDMFISIIWATYLYNIYIFFIKCCQMYVFSCMLYIKCIFSKFRALNFRLLRDPNVCSFILQVVISADTNSTLCSCLPLENNHKCLELITCTL